MFLMALVRTRCFGSICLSPLRMRDGKWRKLLAWTPSRRGGLRLEEQAEPGVEQGQGYLRVTVLAACGKEADPSETAWVDCYVGENWVVTAHTVQLAVIDDFREHAEGEGAIGILDAPSFLSAASRVGRHELLASVRQDRSRSRGVRCSSLGKHPTRRGGADRPTGRGSSACWRSSAARLHRIARSSQRSASPNSIRYQAKVRQRDSSSLLRGPIPLLLPPATPRTRSSAHSMC